MSSATALRSLTITAFRGSTQTLRIDFDPRKKLSLVYGENGTGKTTVCDAFEFLARDEIGWLRERGLGAGLTKFWHSVGRQAADLRVRLETGAGTCEGKVIKDKAVVAPIAARPRVELLRRGQLLQLIEAAPAKRYEAIKRFIDIEAFERSEKALRDLGASLDAEKRRAAEAELQSLDTLRSYHETAGGAQGGNPVTWAEERLAQAGADRRTDVAALGKLRTRYAAFAPIAERWVGAVDALVDAQTHADAAGQAQLAAMATVADGAEATLELLEQADALLGGRAAIEACPLCESTQNAADLKALVQRRLETLKELRTVRGIWKARHADLAQVKAKAGSVDADHGAARGAFVEQLDLCRPLVGFVAPAEAPPADPGALGAWLDATAALEEGWAAHEAEWRGEDRFVATLRDAVATYHAKRDERCELDRLIPRATSALDLCVEERQAFTTALIVEIAKEVGQLYEQVHPGEGLDRISLPLDPNQRASIKLAAEFGGRNAPPQAYFSQSHLDTLGLCVFLALALRERADETVLILDDVLGSVDEPHVDRVIAMIYAVSKRFRHTLVTTHYRPWREKYRWGLLADGQQCQFIELTAWQLADGMRVTTSMPEVARLKAMLAADDLDVQAACGKAGVILEAMLSYLTLKYQCRLPRKPGGDYTVAELLQSFDKDLRSRLRIEVRDIAADPVGVEEVMLAPIITELLGIYQARNVFGAHYNERSFELPDADALRFAHAVARFADVLICPDHGWPSNGKTGSYWRNAGDTRRLHPLRQPS